MFVKDVITDLTANLEEIPVQPQPPLPFLGHKGTEKFQAKFKKMAKKSN